MTNNTPNPKSKNTSTSKEGVIKEFVKTVIVAVLIATVFRTFFYEPFNIPSESMMPTLMTGDYIFVSKMHYGYSYHSFPLSPRIFSGRIAKGSVERGDIAVFKLPRDNDTDYIKRIIGLPGDRIQVINGVLYLNGLSVTKQFVGEYVFEEQDNTNCLRWPQYRHTREGAPVQCRYPLYREQLPNGVAYMTLDLDSSGMADNTGVYTVPTGHYFAMGDNRDNSTDSRWPSSIGVGFVPEENLVGRAEIIFYSTNGHAALWQVWKWISSVRYERLFRLLAS